MKKLLFLLSIAIILFSSCRKAPGAQSVSGGAISADLKSVIESENIDGVVICCVDCSCNITYSEEGEYEFQGANFILINSIAYNLNNLDSYDVQSVEDPADPGENKRFLVLFFP